MPVGFDRFNWAALLLGGFWAVFYHDWLWLGLFAGIWVVAAGFGQAALALGAPVDAVSAVRWTATVVSLIARVIFAARANKAFWLRRARIESGRTPSAPGGQTMRGFESEQRFWVVATVIGLALGHASDFLADDWIPSLEIDSGAFASLGLTVAMLLVGLVVALVWNHSRPARHSEPELPADGAQQA